MTTEQHRWTIGAIGSPTVHAAGTAATITDIYTAALRAARIALLAGELDSIAVTVDGQLDALYTPGRDSSGELDPSAVTASLVDLHQVSTAGEVTDQLVGRGQEVLLPGSGRRGPLGRTGGSAGHRDTPRFTRLAEIPPEE